MADRTSSSIVVAASPAEVMAVIADFESYPSWAGVKSATVLTSRPDGRAEEVNIVIDVAVVKDDYVLAYVWDGDRSVSWNLLAGRSKKGSAQKGQEGSYVLTEVADGTRVDYELAVELSFPMLGMLKRKAEKTIVDLALNGLSKRVVELHGEHRD